MATSKELRNNPELNINLFELFSLFSHGGKSKYTEMLFRVMKNTPNIDDHCKEIKEKLFMEFDITSDSLSKLTNLQLVFFYKLLDGMFEFSDLKTFQKFCEYNERNLITKNDTSSYKTFDEINNAVSMANLIAEQKDLEKQVKIVYEDNEWLLLRPLTYNASKKYGSNTKWCTTTERNPEYFVKYSKKGVLIYCMNKLNGYKVASFRSLDKSDPEFSFWNQQDTRIDSLQTELPDSLLKVIRTESLENPSPNQSYLGKAEREKEKRILSEYGKFEFTGTIEELPTVEATQHIPINQRVERISRALRVNDEMREYPIEENSGETENLYLSRLVDINFTNTDGTSGESPLSGEDVSII